MPPNTILDELERAEEKARSATRSVDSIGIVDLAYAIGHVCSAVRLLLPTAPELDQPVADGTQQSETKRILLQSRERENGREWHVAVKTDVGWGTAYLGDATGAGNVFKTLQAFERSVAQQARNDEREELARWFEARAKYWEELAHEFLKKGDVSAWGARDNMASSLRENAKAIRLGECWEEVPLLEIRSELQEER